MSGEMNTAHQLIRTRSL